MWRFTARVSRHPEQVLGLARDRADLQPRVDDEERLARLRGDALGCLEHEPEPAAPADARGGLLLGDLGRPAAVPAERLDGAAVCVDPDGAQRSGHVPTLRRAADTCARTGLEAVLLLARRLLERAEREAMRLERPLGQDARSAVARTLPEGAGRRKSMTGSGPAALRA